MPHVFGNLPCRSMERSLSKGTCRQLSVRSIRDNLLFGDIPEAVSMGNPFGHRLNTIIPILSNEFTYPFMIITIENYILCASHNKAIEVNNFRTGRRSSARCKHSKRQIWVGSG